MATWQPYTRGVLSNSRLTLSLCRRASREVSAVMTASEVQVIFCAGHDEFNRRHSRLPQANQQEQGVTCVDLVLDVRADGTLGHLYLEGISIEETQLDAGMVTDSEAVSQVGGRPIAGGASQSSRPR